MRKIDYYKMFLRRLDEFLGIKLELKARGNQIDFIPEFNSSFIKKTLEEIGEIFLIIDAILEQYYENSNSIYFSDLIEEFCQKLVGHMVRKRLTITHDQIVFIDTMKKICNETYESEKSNLNILFFKDKESIESELKKLKMEFLPFEIPKEVKEIFKEQLPLKLLNGENLVLIVGNDFKGYGVGINIEKDTLFNERSLASLRLKNHAYIGSFVKMLSQEVLDQLDQTIVRKHLRLNNEIDEEKIKKLVNYSNNKMTTSKVFFRSYNRKKIETPYIFMEVKNSEFKIFFQDSVDNYLSYRGGKWKLKSFHMLKFLIIEKFYMDSFLYHLFKENIQNEEIIEKLILNIDVLVTIIKDLLETGKGGLFIIFKRTIKKRERENMFLGENKSIYKKTVLRNSKHNSLSDHNFEYLKLIAKIDGAVVLDNEFNLLSFGRLVKLNTDGVKEKVEGARTAAAISGSKYGLAIKVSEDKHITVWEDGIKVLEI